MKETPEGRAHPGPPLVIRRKRRPGLVWIVPCVAMMVGLSMLVHAWLAAGPEITITFQTAEGLEAGKTPVKYKDVTVGTVTAVELSADGAHVAASVSLVKNAASLVRADTKFWVVRPRVGMGGISGINTLLSGAYIGLDKGSASAPAKTFVGLENPPAIINGMPGTSFAIHADDLGSLDIGSPVYYRRIEVGRLTSYQLNPNGHTVDLQVFVNAPYDRLVTTDSRFWNASGVDVSLGADGLKLNTQSLATVVAGGIAFANPPTTTASHAAPGTVFGLVKDEQTAMAAPDGAPQYIQLRFERSLRGLSVGAPVQFAGLDIGHVVSVKLDYNRIERRFPSVVGIEVFPNRLGDVVAKLPRLKGGAQQQAAAFLGDLVAHGLRAQARPGNLLTGQLYIALDFVPNAPAAPFDMEARPISIPTVNGSFDEMQEQIAGIVAKVNKMPLDSIGEHLDASLVDLDRTLQQVHGQLLPATTQTMQQAQKTLGAIQGTLADDAPLQQGLTGTFQEVQRAARSLRTLTDLLGRHPEALLRGRPNDTPMPPSPPTRSSNAQEPSR